MRDAKVRVYKFSELDGEARERAMESFIELNREFPFAGEVRDSIEAFEEEFGVDIDNWSYSSCGHDYQLHTGRIDDDVLNLRGNRARAWFWNNHRSLWKPAYMCACRMPDGKLRPRCVGQNSIHRRSKMSIECSCPWTGWCYDMSLLTPMLDFMDGVEYDERIRRRVKTSRIVGVDNLTTVEGVLDMCVESLFCDLQKECEYNESEEYIADNCEANGYEFTEEGKFWCGAREVS